MPLPLPLYDFGDLVLIPLIYSYLASFPAICVDGGVNPRKSGEI
jgi:hypothetical protein